jgi:excisionase family DNA binding protein
MEGEEHYSPAEAARILRLTPHRVRQMLNAGDLEGEQESGEKGRRWRIPKRAVHALLEERPAHRRRVVRRGAGFMASSGGAAGPSERELELEEELKTLNREMGRLEGRLELTELTESTLRAERERLLEDLEREKRRAEIESEKAGELEERLQLSARAESSLRVERARLSGDLEQEKERAADLEQELLRAQQDAHRLAADLEARRRRGFWSRLFRSR